MKNQNLLIEAIEKNELSEFMFGSNPKYYLVCPYADMPTDPDQVFDAFKEYFTSTKSNEIWTRLENEMIKLIETSEGAWLCIYYLSISLSYFRNINIKYIDTNKIISFLEIGLKKFEKELLINKSWVGSDYKEGLWGDCNRLVSIINKKFSLNIKLF